MAISVAELEAILSVNAEKFNSGIASVKGKLGEIESSMKNLNTGGIAFGTLLGNLGSRVIGGAFNMLKNAGKDALEYASYNENVRISLDSIAQADLKRTNGMVEYVKIGEKTVQVQGHFQQAAQLSGKALEKQNKLIEKAHDAVAKLDLAEARYQQKQNKPPVKNKKETDQQYQDRLNVYNKTFPVLDNNIAKLNKTIAAGSNLNAPKWVDAYSKVVPIMQRIQHETLTDAQIKQKAADQTKKTINELELMAINSKYNKKDMVDSFSLLRTMGTYANDQALKIQQGIADIASVRGLDGSGLMRIATVYGRVGSLHRVYWRDIQQMAATAPGFMQRLADQMGVKVEALKKMSSKGLIPQEAFEKTMNGLFEEYKDKAKEMAKTLPGLISSFQDLRQFTLANFFTPIFESFKPALEGIVNLLSDKGIQSRIAAAGERIGKAITGIFEKANKIIGPIVASISSGGFNLSSIISGLSNALKDNAIPSTWGSVVVTVLTFIRDHGQAIATVLGTIATAMAGLMIASQVSSAMGTLSTVVSALTSPLGLLGAAIGFLYIGFQTNFLGIRDIIMGVWKDIQPYWDNFVDIINVIRNGGLDWKGLFSVDPTGMAKPIVDFIAGLPKTLGDAVANLKEGDIKGVFDALWQGFGLRGLDIVNAISAFVKNATTAIKNKAPEIAGSFFGWAAGALNWLNLTEGDILTKITGKGGLIENIGAALGNAVGFLEKVIQPWLKTFAGKALTPEEKDMKTNTEAFLTSVASLINTSVNGIAEVGKAFVRGFWQAAGQNISEGANLFWEGIKKNFSAESINKAMGGDGKNPLSLSNLLFGGASKDGAFAKSPVGQFTAENFNLFPPGTTLKSFIEHALTPFDKRPENVSVPINVTLDIKNLEEQGMAPSMIQAYMNANGIYTVGGEYFYALGGTGKIASTAGTYIPVQVPVQPTVTMAPATMGLAGGASGPVAPITTTTMIQQAMTGMQLQADGANGLKVQNTVTLTVPVDVKTNITTQPPVLNGTQQGKLADFNQIIYDETFGKNKVTINAGTNQASITPLDVNVPINAKVDVSTTNPTTQTTVSVTDSVAQSAGLTKDTNGNYTLPNASNVTVGVPVNVKLGLPTLGKDDLTSKQELDKIVDYYLSTAGMSKDDTGYSYAGTKIVVTVPIDVQITGSGNQGGQSGGGDKQSPIITSLVNNINTDANKAAVTTAIDSLYNAGLSNFITQAKLGAVDGGSAGKGSLAYVVGGQIGDALANGLEYPMRVVTGSFTNIITKLNEIKDTDLPNVKTGLSTFVTAINGEITSGMNTFTNGPLASMNAAFKLQFDRIEGIIGALGRYKTALEGFQPPGNLGGGTSGTSGDGKGDAGTNFRTSAFSNPGFQNGTEGRITNITLVSTVDSDQVSKKTYRMINNQFLQEVGDY